MERSTAENAEIDIAIEAKDGMIDLTLYFGRATWRNNPPLKKLHMVLDQAAANRLCAGLIKVLAQLSNKVN
jgi:hypothetical protein